MFAAATISTNSIEIFGQLIVIGVIELIQAL
jgi:hypothetical protein